MMNADQFRATVLEGGYTIPVSQRKKDFVIQFLEGR